MPTWWRTMPAAPSNPLRKDTGQEVPFAHISDDAKIGALMKELDKLDDKELVERFRAFKALQRRLEEAGPQTRDELHAWLIDTLGLDIPRVSVCPEHDAPFDFLADLFFEETEDGDPVGAALLMANRGGSKTFLVALLHWLNSKFKPGCESCTFGATEAQSLRAYSHLKHWIYDDQGERKPEIAGSIMRETIWRNGSRVEVLAGTPEAVNGPHPQKAHADEIELMREDTWKESRNMTISKQLPNGRVIRPQDISTSTRKGPNGRMQQLIDEIEQAIRDGFKPPRKLYQWCIFETAAQVPNCQVALGLDPNDLDYQGCDCHVIRRGEWEDGKPRLLRDICKGGFYKSRGWQPKEDVNKQFTENDQETFEIQQLCAKPEMKFHYVPSWSDERHCIRNYVPDPALGPIFLAVDWGGTNPSAVNWYQRLKYDIEVEAWLQPLEDQNRKIKVALRPGTIVCFDEIYKAEIGATRLADMVIAREARYRQQFGPDWKVEERFADPQGKMARKDWAYHKPPLATHWHTTRNFDEHIDTVSDTFDFDLFRVDGVKCPMFVAEIKAWRKDPKTLKQIDEFNHCMSNFRYALANIKALGLRLGRQTGMPAAAPIERQAGVTTVIRTGDEAPIGFDNRGLDEFDQWRKRLGSPVTVVTG